MIVPTMSNREVFDALSADKEKLEIKSRMLVSGIAKQFKKENKYPAWKCTEFTHKESQNRYLISFYAATPNDASKPDITYLAFMECGGEKVVIQWGCWLYRKTGSLIATATRYIGYYSAHFFKRYRERIWPDAKLSHNELLCRFFSRNPITVPLELNKDIQRRYEKYGEYANYAFQIHDGTCFMKGWNEGNELSIGEPECDFISVIMYFTFVNGGMMAESQKEAINKEEVKYLNNFYKELLEDALNENFFRTHLMANTQ